jgi:hypothetical protein
VKNPGFAAAKTGTVVISMLDSEEFDAYPRVQQTINGLLG